VRLLAKAESLGMRARLRNPVSVQMKRNENHTEPVVSLVQACTPGVSWGKKWGKKPHRSQPISADLDLAKTA
jgi:hypothetical protein